MPDTLTPEQRAAIETVEADLCVSAGAGSGKTRVLVERFLRLAIGDGRAGDRTYCAAHISDPEGSKAGLPLPAAKCELRPTPERSPAGVDAILALTFTRKAAVEMKGRIARALVERGLAEERRRLEVAAIGTIHTFCERVLRENPFEAGLDPEFSVLDEADASLLLAQANERVLEQAFARERDPVAELALTCFDRRTQDGDGIARLQEDAVNSLRALAALGWGPADAAAWAAEPLQQFEARALAFLREQTEPVITTFQHGMALLSNLTLGKRQMEENRKQIVATGAALACGAGAGVEEQLRLLGTLRPLLTGRQTKEMDPQAYAIANEQFEAMKQAYDGIKDWAAGWSAEGERRAQTLARAGLELVARLWSQYETLKRERAALDFADLQRLTRDLLRDAPAVRARLCARLPYVMVDEFQDTDRLQVEILDLLRAPRRFFFVGDVKQSIYRFRNADVRLFREREQAVRAVEATDPAAARRLALAVNFRSRPEILAFVNGLFARLGEQTGAPHEPLTAGRSFDPKPAPAIDLLPVPSEGGMDTVRRAEAAAVARRARELIDAGAAITRADHPERGRALHARDFVLLLRSLRQVSLYEQALEAAGFDTFVVGGRSYYARREVRDVVNLLKTIHHPLDDLAVASTLRSPFAGISLDTLALLSFQARSQPDEPRCLYGAIRPALDAQPIEPEDADRLRAFAALIDRIREREDRLPVGQILEMVLAETDYLLEALRRRGGHRTLANVRKLQQMAHQSAAGGVGEFIERIEALTRVNEHEGDAPTHTESADVVRLMTIHQAKGLEFPVVILPDLGRIPRRPDTPLLALDPNRRLAAFSGEAGALPPLHHALAEADRAADQAESLRLLYVALTRAEEHLILSGPRPARPGSWGHQMWPHLPLDGTTSERHTVDLFDGQARASVLRDGAALTPPVIDQAESKPTS